jgi:hypothetical protein
MYMVRIKIAPDIEFSMEMDLAGIDELSRDYDVQQKKAIVFEAFMAKLQKAFPESDIHIDTFEFGLEQAREMAMK